MEDDSFPLGVNVNIEISKPFAAKIPNGPTVILQAESMYNAYGDLIHYTEVVLDDSPSEQELFKVKLSNPEQETQIAWGIDTDTPFKGYVGSPPNTITPKISMVSTEEAYCRSKDS